MDEQRKHTSVKRSYIFELSLFALLLILLVITFVPTNPKPTSVYFEDIDELTETLTDLVKYPSYFPEGFNFFDEYYVYTHVSISGGYTYTRNPNKRTRKDFFDYDISIADKRLNVNEEWQLHQVSVSHNIREFIYRESGFPDDRMTLIGQKNAFNIYLYTFEYEGSYVYSYWFFCNDNVHVYYSFFFFYRNTNQISEGSIDEEVSSYSFEEAEKMFDSLKTYEEMREFLQSN